MTCRAALKQYRLAYCYDAYGKCRIAKMLFEKWEVNEHGCVD